MGLIRWILAIILGFIVGVSSLILEVFDIDLTDKFKLQEELNAYQPEANIGEAELESEKGYELMNDGDIEGAIECFNNALELGMRDDTLYNNLSWAYYEFGDYEKSLEYIEQALSIQPNTENEFVNAGNAYSGLGLYDEAVEHYNEAIKVNEACDYAHYGLGVLYYDFGEYNKAIDALNNCLEYEPSDIDASKYIVHSYIQLEDYDNAEKYVNELISTIDDDIELYEIKGTIYEMTKDFNEVESYYRQIGEEHSGNIEAKILLGNFYYNQGLFNKANKYFEELLQEGKHSEVYLWLIYSNSYIGDFDKALEYSEEAVTYDKDNSELYLAYGNVYYDLTDYFKAIEYYDKAIALNSSDITPYSNKLWAYLNAKRYRKCIDYANELEALFPGYEDIPWAKGEAFYMLNESENAIAEYQKYSAIYPYDETTYYTIAECYFNLGEFIKAQDYINHCLAINSEYEDALWLQEQIEFMDLKAAQQIWTLFNEDYLYEVKQADLDRLLNDEYLYSNNTSKLVDTIKDPADEYTFVIDHIDQYEEFVFGSYLEYDLDKKKVVYIKIKEFGLNSDNEFIEILDSIDQTESKKLIIDLRGNGGGMTDCANNMLDVLLPQCTTSTLINRYGYNYSYYSDATQIEFAEIVILVDEYTASASELLALGLKTYLNNVTIAGRTTVGKGVGQYVYEDMINNRVYFIVNHYWNVREHNIMNKGITPDIILNNENQMNDYIETLYQ